MSASPEIPHPPWRVPIIGDIVGIDSRRPNQKTLHQFERLGPIYRRSILGAGDLTFVGNANLASTVLDEEHWERYTGRPIRGLRVIAGDGLFTADSSSDAWRTGHEVLSRGFTQESMRTYHDAMLETSMNLVDHLAASPRQDAVELLTNRAALDIIGKCGFSYPFWDSPESEVFSDALQRSLLFTQSASIPFVGNFIERRGQKQFSDDVESLHGVIIEVMGNRRKIRDRDAPSGDLLGVMMESGDLSDAAMRDQIITFLIAGHETTGNLLAFALFYLARDAALVEALRREREAVLAETGTNRLRYEDVAKLRVTRAVISEVLRLWPTAPGFFRAARCDTRLGDFQFSEGEWVFLLLLAVHRDEAVWGETASQFDHKRFLRKLPAGAVYRPFGVGPRACIGRQFALHEATVVISELSAAFNIGAGDDTDTPVVDENLTLRPRVAATFERC